MSAPDPAPPRRLLAPELSLYRRHCLALLRRYFTMSVESGRVPALLGREFFRTRIRSCRVLSFEDMVIFLHDVERCLARLEFFDQALIARLVFQEYTKEEAARLLHCTVRTVERRFPEAIDSVTEMFLANGMLETGTRRYRRPPIDPAPPETALDLLACAAESSPASHIGREFSPRAAACQAPQLGILLVTRCNARKNIYVENVGFAPSNLLC